MSRKGKGCADSPQTGLSGPPTEPPPNSINRGFDADHFYPFYYTDGVIIAVLFNFSRLFVYHESVILALRKGL